MRRWTLPIARTLTRRLAKAFRITDGRKFRLRPDRPGRHARDRLERGDRRSAEARTRPALRHAGEAVRARHLGAAGDHSGDGCGRQGQRRHARDVGPEPARLPGVLVQGALGRGSRPRLSVADDAPASRAGTHRRLQPLLLRGSAGRARASGDPRRAGAAAGGGLAARSGRSASRTSTASNAISIAAA